MKNVAESGKTVVIIEDHPMTREGIKLVLNWEPGFSPVLEAGTAKEGLELIRSRRPSFAILDLSLPDRNGLEIIKRIRSISPETKILVLTMYSRSDFIRRAMASGAHGYLVKESSPDSLLKAIRRIEEGGYYFDEIAVDEIVRFFSRDPGGPEKEPAEVKDLSKRETEILRYVAEGYSVKEIAFMLSLSPKTVENHRYRLMRKLNVADTVDLVRFALRRGVVSIEDWLK